MTVPNDNSHKWVAKSRPLAEALREGPKTMKELQALRIPDFLNCLAWLENRGLVWFQHGTWRIIQERSDA